MKRKFWLFAAMSCLTALTIEGCRKNDHHPDIKDLSGYLYTSTNGEGENNVVRFTRHTDGSLTDEKSYATGSKGGADVNAGGDAHGDFDAQGSIQIIGNYLLAVNAGGNTVSTFKLDKKTGDLTFLVNTNSGGTRPVSIAWTKKQGSESDYWVVVGNQWNNPNIQKDGAAIERYPDDAFYKKDLSAADATDDERNIQLFSFNGENGVLTGVKQLDKYVRENGGPTTVSFSSDGTKLAVSTWGIAHFDTKVTSLDEQHSSRVYVYDFANGNVSSRRFFEESGISGTIGLSWAAGSNTKMYVSNFNLIPEKHDNSVTVLADKGSGVDKTANLGATKESAINEACWTALNPAGDKLYVASFQTNLVTAFDVSGPGLQLDAVEARGDLAPHGDSKELWVSPDGRFIYNLGSFQSFSINRFDINGASILYRSQTVLSTTAAGTGIAGKYNFLGLAGFDVKKDKAP